MKTINKPAILHGSGQIEKSHKAKYGKENTMNEIEKLYESYAVSYQIKLGNNSQIKIG